MNVYVLGSSDCCYYTNADDSRWVGHGLSVCLLSVCLTVFSQDISKNDAAMITKLGIERFHDESWKTVYSEATRSKVKVVRTFVLCGQGSSLLWTPALRPLYRSNAPDNGEDGNCWVCVVYVRIV